MKGAPQPARFIGEIGGTDEGVDGKGPRRAPRRGHGAARIAGLNLTTAVNVFLRQCVINHAVPFPLALDAQRGQEPADNGD